MLCVTGGERRVAALAARLQANDRAPLQEVRLDLLEDLDGSVFPLLRDPRRLVTCRPRAQGGGFGGSEVERLDLLQRALREGPGFLDAELELGPAAWQSLLADRGTTRLICSHHVLEPGADPRPLIRRLLGVPAWLHKLAVAVEDAAELGPLLELGRERSGARRVLVGMGAAGLLSRALADRFGSPWSYVCADGSPATAPGQLTLAEASAWRLERSSQLAPIVLLGGEQVLRSPGPRVYNRLFSSRGLPYLYLPVVTQRAGDTLRLLEALGTAGASVTMPLKEQVLPLLDEVDDGVRACGAANSIRLRTAGRRSGRNTDLEAIAALAGDGAGRHALVLGAGGAARAAVVALKSRGFGVSISNRSHPRAELLASSQGLGFVPWEERSNAPAELIVNATPSGSDGESDPIAGRRDLRGCTVLDLALCPSGATPLARRAAGARVISGLDFWLEQGARQMSWLTGEAVTPEELRSHLP